MLVGLLLTLAGALRLVWGGLDGWALIAIGGLAIAGAYVALSRLAPRTQYHDRRWSLLDTWVVIGALIALGILLVSRRSLNYSPYPHLTAPSFSTWVGMAILGLAVPVIITLLGKPAIEAPI